MIQSPDINPFYWFISSYSSAFSLIIALLVLVYIGFIINNIIISSKNNDHHIEEYKGRWKKTRTIMFILLPVLFAGASYSLNVSSLQAQEYLKEQVSKNIVVNTGLDQVLLFSIEKDNNVYFNKSKITYIGTGVQKDGTKHQFVLDQYYKYSIYKDVGFKQSDDNALVDMVEIQKD